MFKKKSKIFTFSPPKAVCGENRRSNPWLWLKWPSSLIRTIWGPSNLTALSPIFYNLFQLILWFGKWYSEGDSPRSFSLSVSNDQSDSSQCICQRIWTLCPLFCWFWYILASRSDFRARDLACNDRKVKSTMTTFHYWIDVWWQVKVGHFVLLIISQCCWPNFDIDDFFLMLVPDDNVKTDIIIDTGCWWRKRIKPSPTSQNCRQHISSQTTVTNINVVSYKMLKSEKIRNFQF